MNKAATCQVIVCAGAGVSPECSRVIANFGHGEEDNQALFVIGAWLTEDQFRRSVLLWIVDNSTPWDSVHFALRHGIPLLVSEDNLPLRHLCASGRCGIWYRDEADAQRCVEYLLANSSMRDHLGASGRAYLNHPKSSGV